MKKDLEDLLVEVPSDVYKILKNRNLIEDFVGILKYLQQNDIDIKPLSKSLSRILKEDGVYVI